MQDQAQQATIPTVASAKAPTPSTPVKKKAVVKSKTKTAPKKTDSKKPQDKASVAAKDKGKAPAPSTPQATTKSQTQSQSSNSKAPTKRLVTETYLIKPAWNETIHHDATYKTVSPFISSDGKFRTTSIGDMTEYNLRTGTTHTTSPTQVGDKPTYDETVHHDATYETVPVYEDKTVVDKPAWDEQVQVGTDHQLVKAAWDETVNHPASTVDKTVVDKPAWNENKLIRNAYTSRDHVQVGSRWIAAQGHWATR